MLKVILALIVFLALLFPVTTNSAIKDLEKNVDIGEVIKQSPIIVYRGLLDEKNFNTMESFIYFEDRIINKKSNLEYYLRLAIDPSSGIIIGLVTAMHLYNPDMLYRVVLLDVYELDINSVGEGKENIKYKHYLKAYTIFYNKPGSLVADKTDHNTLTREVFKDVLKEFEKKYSSGKNPFRNHAFRGLD